MTVYLCANPGCPWRGHRRERDAPEVPAVGIGQGLFIQAKVVCECGAILEPLVEAKGGDGKPVLLGP